MGELLAIPTGIFSSVDCTWEPLVRNRKAAWNSDSFVNRPQVNGSGHLDHLKLQEDHHKVSSTRQIKASLFSGSVNLTG